MKKCWIILVLVLVLSLSVYGEKLTAYVTDNAGLLTIEQENLLTTHIETMEGNTGYEIAIVTVQTTNGDDRFWFAYELGEGNGVGKAETDNGIVILWSVEDEHGGAIATGRGAEVAVTDADVNRIGGASRAYFDEGQYYEGFEYILTEIEKETSQETFANTGSSDEISDEDTKVAVILAIVVILAIIVVIGIAVSDGGSGGSGSSFRSSSYVGHSFSGGGWSGGGGSSGFGGFGGGGFGGGGGRF